MNYNFKLESLRMQYLSVDDQDKLSSLPLLNKLAGRDHSVSYETTDT